jgi:hypothetical protein
MADLDAWTLVNSPTKYMFERMCVGKKRESENKYHCEWLERMIACKRYESIDPRKKQISAKLCEDVSSDGLLVHSKAVLQGFPHARVVDAIADLEGAINPVSPTVVPQTQPPKQHNIQASAEAAFAAALDAAIHGDVSPPPQTHKQRTHYEISNGVTSNS